MLARRLLPPFLAASVVLLAACGSDDPAAVDTDDRTPPAGEVADERVDPEAGDALLHPDTPIGEDAVDPDASPAGGIEPAQGEAVPVEAVTGRVVAVDRDGPSVEIVESVIVTGPDATDAARAAGEIGPDEQWELDFYVVEGARRWVDIDPAAAVAVYDCSQACEHVAGTVEQVLTGAPYGGPDALWSFTIGADGRAAAVDELYLP